MRSGPRRKVKERAALAPFEIEEQEFFFPEGVLGFSSARHFFLGPFQPPDGGGSPFLILREAEGHFSFPLIPPRFVLPEYEVTAAPEILARIGARSARDLVVLAIVTLKERLEAITVNLAGPLLLNPAQSLGMQIVLDRYPVRHLLLEKPSVPRI